MPNNKMNEKVKNGTNITTNKNVDI